MKNEFVSKEKTTTKAGHNKGQVMMGKLKFSKEKQVMSVDEFKSLKKKSRNKMNAGKMQYKGRIYHSIKECEHAQQLDLRKMAGEITEIIPQFKIDIRVNNIHICNYFIDFRIKLKDGTYEYHEVKGFSTDLWRIKWLLSKALHPDWKFILIKV